MTLPATEFVLAIVAAVALLAGAGFALIYHERSSPGTPTNASIKRFARMVRGEAAGDLETADRNLEGLFVRFGQIALVQSLARLDPEVATLIQRAGLRGRNAFSAYAGAQFLAIVFSLLLATAMAIVLDLSQLASMGILFVSFAFAYLSPKMLLRKRAQQREGQIVDELPDFAQLLRILFDSGLSTEQALEVMTTGRCGAVATLNQEVSELLRRLRSGSNLSDATKQIAAELGIKELAELFTLLRQIQRHGGAVEKPLANFIDLLEDRRRTQIQERVNRISAQMTVVMVSCLLPALLVFLAGPGFLAVIEALGKTHG